MAIISLNFRFWLRSQWLKFVKKANFVPEQSIFFIHIPKTAGTSFRNMLFRHIDQQVAFPNLLDLGSNQGFYPALENLGSKVRQTDREIKLLTGHYPFAAGQLLPSPPQYFVFIREPVARTISNLLHFQRNSPDCKKLSLIEIFHKYRPHLQNLQTRYLCDTSIEKLSCFYQPDLSSEKSLLQAKANLEKCTFVGITEKFSESIQIAEHLLGAKLGHQLKRNVSPFTLREQDSLLVNQLIPYLDLDLKLYQHALKLFEKQESRILKS